MKKHAGKKKKALATRPSSNPILECLNNTKDVEHVFLKIINFSSNLDPEEADQLLLVPRSNSAVPLLNRKYFNIIKKCREVFQDDKMPLYHMISKCIEHPQQNDSQVKTEIRVANILYFIRYKICVNLIFSDTELKKFNIPLTLQSDLTQRLYKILLKLLPANESPINLSEHQENMKLIEKYRGLLERVSRENIILLHCKNLIIENKIHNRHLNLIIDLILLKIRMTFYYMSYQPSIAFKAAHEAIMIFNYFKKFIEPIFPHVKEMKRLLEESQRLPNRECEAFTYNELESNFNLAKHQVREDDFFIDENFIAVAKKTYSTMVKIKKDITKPILNNIHNLFKEFFCTLNRCDKDINNPQIILLLPCLRYLIEGFSKRCILTLETGFYRIAFTELFNKILDNIRSTENAYIPKNTLFNRLIKGESLDHNVNICVSHIFWQHTEAYLLILENYIYELNVETLNTCKLMELDEFNKIQQELMKGDHFINAIFFFVNLACNKELAGYETFFIRLLDKVLMLFIINYNFFSKRLIVGEYYNQFFERLLSYTYIINKIEILLGEDQRLEILKSNQGNAASYTFDTVAITAESILQNYRIFSKFENIFLVTYEIFINKFMVLKDHRNCRKDIQAFLYQIGKNYIFDKSLNPVLQNDDHNLKSLFSEAKSMQGVVSFLDKIFEFKEKFYSVWDCNKELRFLKLEKNTDITPTNILNELSLIRQQIEILAKQPLNHFLAKINVLLDSSFESFHNVINMKEVADKKSYLTETKKVIMIFVIYFKKIDCKNEVEQILTDQLQEKLREIVKFTIEKMIEFDRLQSPNKVTSQIPQAILLRTQKADSCIPSLPLSEQNSNATEAKSKKRTTNRLRILAKAQKEQSPRETSKPGSTAEKVVPQRLPRHNITEADNTLLLMMAESDKDRKEKKRQAHERKQKYDRFSAVQTQPQELSRREKKRQEKRAKKLKKQEEKNLRLRDRKKVDQLCSQQPSKFSEKDAIQATVLSCTTDEVESLTNTIASLTLTDSQNANMMANEEPESIDATSFDVLPPLMDEEPEIPEEIEEHDFLSFKIERYPASVQEIFEEFETIEGNLYLHGGYLRDTFCHVEENDYDFISDCRVEDIVKLGFVQCPFKGKENLYQRGNIDIMLYPKLSPHHLKELAKQADISLNSFCSDKMRRIIDFERAYADVKLKYIKCCDDLEARIKHDPNLILRFIRISNHINKEILPGDLVIMKKLNPLLIQLPFNVCLKSINDLFSRREGYKNYFTLLNEGFLAALQLAVSSSERFDFDNFIENKIKTIDVIGNMTRYKKNIAYSIIALLLFRKILCKTPLETLIGNLRLLVDEIDCFVNSYQGDFADKDKTKFKIVVLKKMEEYLAEFKGPIFTSSVTYTPYYQAYGSPYLPMQGELPMRTTEPPPLARYTQ